MVCSKSLNTSASASAFWIAVDILVNKPHVVNKRLWGRKILHRWDCMPSNNSSWQPEYLSKIKYISELKPEAAETFLEVLRLEFITADAIGKDSTVEVILLELLPKTYTETHAFQLVCLNKDNNKAWFFNTTPNGQEQLLCPDFLFTFELQNNLVVLQAECGRHIQE